MDSRPWRNSSRLRHTESSVEASDTFSGSRVFQASCAALTFCLADASSNGGSGGQICWSVFSPPVCLLPIPPQTRRPYPAAYFVSRGVQFTR